MGKKGLLKAIQFCYIYIVKFAPGVGGGTKDEIIQIFQEVYYGKFIIEEHL